MASRRAAKRKAECQGQPPLTHDLARWLDPSVVIDEGLEPGVRAIQEWCKELGVDGKREKCMIGLLDRRWIASLSTPYKARAVKRDPSPNELRFLFRKHCGELLGWKQREAFPEAVDSVLRGVIYPDHGGAEEGKGPPSEGAHSGTGSAEGVTALTDPGLPK